MALWPSKAVAAQPHDTIANRLILETGQQQISHEGIYRLVYEDWLREGALHKCLVRAYRLTASVTVSTTAGEGIPGRWMLEDRPAIVEERSRLGDWEGDTVHGQCGNIVTVVDRTSRYFDARKVTRRTRDEVTNKMVSILIGQR